VYFNANAAISIAGFSGLFMPELSVALPIWLLVIAAEVVFFIYDYVYTLFIDYYRNKLMRKFR
jgi:uncharacterized membrane protein (DUF106 family)